MHKVDYTWYNGRESKAEVWEILDRVLVNDYWKNLCEYDTWLLQLLKSRPYIPCP